MSEINLEKYANGKIGTRVQMLWNAAGTWPDDMSDKQQNPHGRPRDYYCPTVAGEIVGWEGAVGYLTKKQALVVASMFRVKCQELIKKEVQHAV
jgi:hypothetical protein